MQLFWIGLLVLVFAAIGILLFDNGIPRSASLLVAIGTAVALVKIYRRGVNIASFDIASLQIAVTPNLRRPVFPYIFLQLGLRRSDGFLLSTMISSSVPRNK
jgi:hypothetical protein